MKLYNIKTLITFGAALFLLSCTSELDINPPQDLASELALSTETNVKNTLIGAYDALSDGDLLGGEMMRNSELLAADGETVFSGTFNAPSEIWRKELTVVNGDVEAVWVDAYNTINITNNILSALDVVNQNDRGVVEGEAKFIRGLLYFELAKYFGKAYGDDPTADAVPIVLTPTVEINESSYVSRKSVSEVYDQAILDLTAAQTLLPADNGDYANSVAASIILSRIYLQMEDYTNALTEANKAIIDAEAEGYALVTDYVDAFNNSTYSSEDVFAIMVNSQDGVNSMHTFYAPTAYGGRGDIEIQDSHLTFYDPSDLRLDLFYTVGSDRRTGKWMEQYGNVNVIRLAEAYLTRAECNIRLTSTVGDTPDNDINMIRSRAGLTSLIDATLDDVLLERKLELAHEGHALWDFKRTKGYTYTLNGGDGLVDGFAWNAKELVYPVPDREIKVNSNLTQNAGY